MKIITRIEATNNFIREYCSKLRKWIWFRSEIREMLRVAVLKGIWIANNYPDWRLYSEEKPLDGTEILLFFGGEGVEYCKYDSNNRVINRILDLHNPFWTYCPDVPPPHILETEE